MQRDGQDYRAGGDGGGGGVAGGLGGRVDGKEGQEESCSEEFHRDGVGQLITE